MCFIIFFNINGGFKNLHNDHIQILQANKYWSIIFIIKFLLRSGINWRILIYTFYIR